MKGWIMLMVFLLLGAGCERPQPRTSGELGQEVYIWQRSWTSAASSLAEARVNPTLLVPLAAEVSFDEGSPRSILVAIDWEALKTFGAPVGVAVRSGPYPGEMGENDEGAKWLGELAARAVTAARASGVEPREIQLDFDCPESKLAGYGGWVKTIRRRIGKVPLVITALPSWLGRPEFKELVSLTDGFVLQVHSLEAPRDVNDRFTLCDVDRSRQWIEEASKLGRPFRVALPTYGYLVGFDGDGKFIGLQAEGARGSWPTGAVVKEVRSDPVELAGLVRSLTADRPANLGGIIWYRMPVKEDRLNWPWETLAAVMAGRAPRTSLKVEARRTQTEPMVIDLDLVNNGETDAAPKGAVTVSWRDGGMVAADGLGGFRTGSGEHWVSFMGPSRPGLDRLRPGERRAVGWVRLEKAQEVEVYADTTGD